ncbi:MAG: acetate--CoA ligase family protein, partial [Hyphomicrobiales bacterium]|nr:acetate--CoA ligase family protein [Hyphomicrobiales bacterium]
GAPIYPVNPKYDSLDGRPCFPSLAALPGPCDVAVVTVPSAHVASVIEQCGAAGIPVAVVLSSGFREIGAAGAMLQEELVAAARRSGVRIVGPNCQGYMNVATRMYAGFGTAFRNPPLDGGPLAMVTQSGSFGYSVVTEVSAAGVGFNYVVSTGNEADVTSLDLIEFFLEQDDVEIVTAYLEGVKDGRRLLALGEKALILGKPILLWKVGNSDSGRRAAVSHTANLTSSPELYRAAFRSGGYIEIEEASDLTDVARAFLARRIPRGRKVAVFTSSGGFGVLLADRCEACGLQLPELSEKTKSALREIVPPYAALSNPVDVTAQLSTDGEGVNRALQVLLDDPGVDQIMVRKGSTDGARGEQWAAGLVALAQRTTKPVLISILTEGSQGAVDIFNRHRLAWSPTARGLVASAAALYEFGLKRERLSERVARTFGRQEIEWPAGVQTLGEHAAKQVLSSYGIGSVREVVLTEQAVKELKASPLPFPVVVKVDSADIAHKTEAGAVRVGIDSLDELKQAAQEVVASARRYSAQARIDGVLVQEMASGVEMMLGVVNDAYFGPVVALGLGGIFAETLRDVTHRCAPFDATTARVMGAELRGSAILGGGRGKAAVDVGALARALSRLSYLAADHSGRIQEIDVNPLFVRERGVLAADALIVLRPEGDGAPSSG